MKVERRHGMSYPEVARILGEPGEEVSRVDIAGISTVMYQWTGFFGANMNAMFQDGKLISKAQWVALNHTIQPNTMTILLLILAVLAAIFGVFTTSQATLGARLHRDGVLSGHPRANRAGLASSSSIDTGALEWWCGAIEAA